MEEADFIYGYCSYIFADIQNNIKNWTPFLLENREALEKGIGSVYHEESCAMDYALCLLNPQQKEMWEVLEDSVRYDIPNVVVADEINKMKQSILHSQFLDRGYVDISLNKYVTFSSIQEFIATESQHIKNLLYQND